MAKDFVVNLKNPEDSPEKLAQKLNTLTYAIDATVIRGLVPREDFDSFKDKTNKYINSNKERIDNSDLRYHGAGLSKVIHDATLSGDGSVSSPLAVVGGGSVSSVSNSDGTLTISPTSGNVVASIALGHANAWTATQTFSNATYSALFTGGNVGIGTASPAGILEIDNNGSSGIDTLLLKQTSSASGNFYTNVTFNNTAGLIGNVFALGTGYNLSGIFQPSDFGFLAGQQNDSTNMLFLTNANGAIKFATGGYAAANERMRITPAGFVGIGTVSPSYPLVVQSGTAGFAFDAASQAFGTTFGTGGGYILYAESPGSATGTSLQSGGSGRGDASRNAFVFAVSGTEVMRIDGNAAGHTIGNVGIGTSNPLLNLQINGSFPGINIVDSSANSVAFQSNNQGAALMRANVYRNAAGTDIVTNSANSQWDFLMIPTASTATESFAIRRSPPGSSTSFVNQMVLTYNGQVSFGTGAGPNGSLEVSGTQNVRMRMSLIANNSDGLYAYSVTPTHIFSLTRQNAIVNNGDLLISALGGVGVKTNVSAPGTTYDFFFSTGGKFGVGVNAPTAFLHPAASTTAIASLRIPSGTAPTSPNSGDVWFDGSHPQFYNGTSTLPLDKQGTVTSVSGTTNRITVATGTTTPVIDIDAAYAGQSSITTLGTVATGTWNASVITPVYGGTGLSAIAQGDILYGTGTNAIGILGKNGSATRYLTNNGTSNNPNWSQVNLANGVTGILPVANGGTGTSTGPTSYAINLTHASTNPADATTLYFGSSNSITTTATLVNVPVPLTGTIKAVYITGVVAGTLGTSETSSLYVRINNATDVTITTSMVYTSLLNTASATGLSQAVTAGDNIQIKWVTPTWATNPTSVFHSVSIYFA